MMAAIQTVRRNGKQYRQALETAHDCKVYTLGNYFIGEDCNPLALVRYMRPDALVQGKLTTDGDGRYTLHVHSNCWFEFGAQS